MRRRRYPGRVLPLAQPYLAAAGLWFVRSRTAPVPYRLVMCGGRNSMGDFSISSGNVFLVSGQASRALRHSEEARSPGGTNL